MMRIILTLVLFCLPLWSHNTDAAQQQKVLKKSIVSIAITSPKANNVFMINNSYIIQWNKFGQMPNTVRIALYNRQGSESVAVIKDSAPNTGSFQWTIPASIPPGTYKIMIKVINTTISDLSDEFKITPAPREKSIISLAITSPKANARWKKEEAYVIRWNKFGQMPNLVQIVLTDRQGSRIADIHDRAANIGSCSWTIPASIPSGTYRIMIRALNTNISDLSDEFRIYDELKSMPVDLGSARQVKVTKPQENVWYTMGAIIPIDWETELHKRILNTNNMLYFDIEFCDAESLSPVFALFKKERYDKLYIGGNKYHLDFAWVPGSPKELRTGFYKIRITAHLADGQAGMPGFSGKFHISRGTEKVTVNLSPQIRDRRSTRRTEYDPGGGHDFFPTQEDISDRFNRQPGRARAGFIFKKIAHLYTLAGRAWGYIGNIYRSQMTFPVEQERKPGKLLLKAYLRLTVEDSALSVNRGEITGYPVPNTCGRNLYYLTSPWSGKCLSTPGYQITTLPDQRVYGFDVTEYAKKWYTGTEPNHGFLLGSIEEEFDDSFSVPPGQGAVHFYCVTWHKPVLILEFQQEKD